MNPRALLHPGIFERTGPLGWFIQENGTSGVVCSPGVSVSPRKTRPLGEEDETSGVSVSPIEDGTS